MPIKAVFFDMGETLCHQSPSTSEILGAFLAERGIEVSPNKLRLAYLAAMTHFSRWTMNNDADERTAEQRASMIEGFYQVALATIGLGDRPALAGELRETMLRYRERRFDTLFPDALPVLEALRGRGLRLGIISNWDLTLIDTVHELGLTPYVDAVVGSANVGIEKPNVAIFQYALARLGVLPEEAYHVGDIYYMDVLGARAAGLTPVLVDRHGLQNGMDCLRVESLLELPSMLDEVDA